MCIMWQSVYISDSQWAMCSWFGAGSSSWIWAGFKTGLNQHEIEMMLRQVQASVLRSLAASAFVLLRDLNCHIKMVTHLQSPHGAKERTSQTSAPTASCPYPWPPRHQQRECEALSWTLQPRLLFFSFKICAFMTLGSQRRTAAELPSWGPLNSQNPKEREWF